MQAYWSCHSLASALLAATSSGINTVETLIGFPIWRRTESDSESGCSTSGLMKQIQNFVISHFQILMSVCTGREEGRGRTATFRQMWLIEGMNGMSQSYSNKQAFGINFD